MASARVWPVAGVMVLSCLASGAPAAGLLTVGDGFLTSPAVLAGQGDGASGVWGTAGQARLWGMAELPVTELSAGWSRGHGSGSIAMAGRWSRIGNGPVRQERIAVRLRGGGRWSMAVQVIGRRVGIESDPGAWRADWSAELGRMFEPGGAVAVEVHLAMVSVRDGGSDEPEPLATVAVHTAGAAGALEVHRGRKAEPDLGVDAWLLGPRGLAVGVRWDGASGSLGPTVAARRGSIMLRTAHTLHPVLGLTHRCELVWGALGAARR